LYPTKFKIDVLADFYGNDDVDAEFIRAIYTPSCSCY